MLNLIPILIILGATWAGGWLFKFIQKKTTNCKLFKKKDKNKAA